MNEYFPHDYKARSDDRMVSLTMSLGMEGVGIYWCIVEMLYECGGKMKRAECERIAFELRTDKGKVRAVLDSTLFDKNRTYFWSKSVLRRLAVREEKSKKARKSAGFRWNGEDANALPTHSERNAIKEKESKENKSMYKQI